MAESLAIVGVFQQQHVTIGSAHHRGPLAAAERDDARRDEAARLSSSLPTRGWCSAKR
jgi:hypothetical protein